MFLGIKNRVEKELSSYCRSINRFYALRNISPVLFKNIKEFILRKGKRVRPVLFVIGYLGFAKKASFGLYRSALSLELLHDFMLVHDDIIDKSPIRRGKASMHAMLNHYLSFSGQNNLKFNGGDLAIVIGDVIYAMALDAFLSIKEDTRRKEKALKKFIETTLYTASGEFVELLYGLKNIDILKKEDIYKIYDLKTSNYTFASPLAIGAVLAGASKVQTDTIFSYGILLGRAFQIKDDIQGLFSEEGEIGKSNLTDLQEAKKTLIIWYAYHNSGKKIRDQIKRILSLARVDKGDLLKMRKIVTTSGALDSAKNEISLLIKKAQALHRLLKMRPEYKNSLESFSGQILKL